MQDTAFDSAAIAADAVALAELHGSTGNECTRIEWLQRRLEKAPGRQYVDGVGNLVWTFGPPPYQLAVFVHVNAVGSDLTHRKPRNKSAANWQGLHRVAPRWPGSVDRR
jgi:hypothetical protein